MFLADFSILSKFNFFKRGDGKVLMVRGDIIVTDEMISEAYRNLPGAKKVQVFGPTACVSYIPTGYDAMVIELAKENDWVKDPMVPLL